MKKTIYLLRIGEANLAILHKLKKDLEWIFKGLIDSVEILAESLPLIEKEYDKFKRQYDGSLILKRIVKLARDEMYYRILGIMDVDIYTRTLNFIFGIAQIPKTGTFHSPHGSLISLTRLEEGFYRRESDQAIFELRSLKEAIHEIGHTFGLSHCKNDCVMVFSNSLMNADNKPPKFCDDCLNFLKQRL